MSLENRISDFRRAVSEGALRIEMQPVADSASCGAPAFHEALLRWRDADGRWQSPGSILDGMPELEHEIDSAALPMVLEVLRREPDLKVSLNASFDVLADLAWVERLRDAVEHDDTLRSRLIIEITERCEIPPRKDLDAMMAVLDGIGVSVLLDDVTPQDPRLAMVGSAPVRGVKLCGSMMGGIDGDLELIIGMSSICDLARTHGIAVVAEQVETEVQSRTLHENCGITFQQGWHWGRPAPRADPEDETPDFEMC